MYEDDIEEELVQDPATDPLLNPDALAADPRVLAAREGRDRDVALANLAQGVTEFSAGLASQGRVKPNTDVFDAARKTAQGTADEALKDATSNRKLVSDYIKGRTAEANRAKADKKWDAKFEQGERQIEAMQAQRDKPTADQSKVSGFGKRLEQAENEFADIAKGGFDRTSAKGAAVSQLPNFVKGYLPQGAEGANSQRQDQAERNFLTAVLRRESGAAISPTEFDTGEKQYFPRFGDTPEVLAQKKRNRDQVITSMKAESGNAWDRTPSVGGGGETKTIKGVQYRKVPGGWEPM